MPVTILRRNRKFDKRPRERDNVSLKERFDGLEVTVEDGTLEDLRAMYGHVDWEWLFEAITNWSKVRIRQGNRKYQDVLFYLKGTRLVAAGFSDSKYWGMDGKRICPTCAGRGYLVAYDVPYNSEGTEDEKKRLVHCPIPSCDARRQYRQWQARTGNKR